MRPDLTKLSSPQEVEFVVEKLVYGGRGLGRQEGRVVLVPLTLPGERVRAKLVRQSRGVAQGALIEVLDPAGERRPAACPYFGRCGGCHYQHTDHAYELAQKEAILRETLRRVGRVEAPSRIEALFGQEWEYRNRIQIHLDGRNLGFMSEGSHEICSIERCPVASPALNAALGELRSMMGDRRFPRFLRSVELFTNETQVQLSIRSSERGVAKPFLEWCVERIPGLTTGPIEYEVAGDRYRVSRGAFFQVNRFLVDRLVENVMGDEAGREAVDLYAGAGLFALPLARRFSRVTAVEAGHGAWRDLSFNAQRAGVAVAAHQATAEAYLDGLSEPPELVVADPPRSGLGDHVVNRLTALRPPRLVVVSCDPATLARDLGGLLGGGYRLESLTLVDLFPRTFHLETVARLRLGPLTGTRAA